MLAVGGRMRVHGSGIACALVPPLPLPVERPLDNGQ